MFVFSYDTIHEVTLDASCAGSSDHASMLINAELPRHPTRDSSVAKLYVTPNDEIVRTTLAEISKMLTYRISKYAAVRDWVSSNIGYAYDTSVHGREYWQLPRETLQRRTGDCEDFSLLLVSLLRATGYSEDRVFVVIGRKSEGYHAWVRIRLDVIGWENVEPQASVLATIIGDRMALSGYVAVCQFNDATYFSIS